MYRDFSHMKRDELDNPSKRKLFPTLLHELISDPQNNDLIIWLPHGRSFKFLKRDRMTPQDLQPYFKMTKVRSFFRQLNGYGFHRVTEGEEKGSYYHEVKRILLDFISSSFNCIFIFLLITDVFERNGSPDL